MEFFRVLLLFGCFLCLVLSVPLQQRSQSGPPEEEQDKFEGDIIVSAENMANVDQSSSGDVDGPVSGSQSTKRNALRDRRGLWTDKIVPYEFGGVPDSYKTVIQSALDEFHSKTCIKFVPHTNQKNWIKFVYKTGCWSFVGKQYLTSGAQEISIGLNCDKKGIVLHELLHALGFWHEQSRSDRNEFVEVMWENIKQGKENNLEKYAHGYMDLLNKPYDFNSIMHYGKDYFTKNGEPTLLGVGANKDKSFGQRTDFSSNDILEIEELYDCKGSSNGWSAWADYGPCDSTCYKFRQRFCAASDRSLCPGVDSYGIETDKLKCPDSECYAPVNGHWGRWSSWSNCTATCGEGTYTRTRKCDDPVPKNGGSGCAGESSETGKCNGPICGLGPDDCDFQSNFCIWGQKDPNNNYKWLRRTGGTATPSTGPAGDASVDGKGYYVYAEASRPAVHKDVAKLQSKEFPATSGRCMHFSYNMNGYDLGGLSVKVYNDTVYDVWTRSGAQGDKWFNTKVTIESSLKYQISFEALRGPTYWGDISLDNILFKDGKCA